MELLNEICEEADEHKQDDTEVSQIIVAGSSEMQNEEEEVEAETEKEENKIIEEIMKALQIKFKTESSAGAYNSVTSTVEGIRL